jgi:hypothetical protein
MVHTNTLTVPPISQNNHSKIENYETEPKKPPNLQTARIHQTSKQPF